MLIVLLYLAVLAVATTGAAARLPRWLATAGCLLGSTRVGVALRQRFGRHEPEPDPGVDLLLRTLELRRLSAEVQRAYATTEPGKYQRVRASVGAYDDVLLECCRAVGVDPPAARGPLTTIERFDVESCLLAKNVQW